MRQVSVQMKIFEPEAESIISGEADTDGWQNVRIL